LAGGTMQPFDPIDRYQLLDAFDVQAGVKPISAT
jgi:hypothetical protein